MAVNDSIADTMTRIRNAQMVGKSNVDVLLSKYVERFLEVLHANGYIAGVEKRQAGSDKKLIHGALRVQIKYVQGRPVISEMKKVSTPGRRVYVKSQDVARVRNGLGISILSTSRGLMTDYEARSQNVGGELLCTIF